MLQVKDYIVIKRGLISPELCREIISEYADSSEWENAAVGADRAVNKKHRDVGVIEISTPNVLGQNLEHRTYLDHQIFKCAGSAVQHYIDLHPYVSVEKDAGYTLLRYAEKQFYAPHVDDMANTARTISCSFSLNDDYVGGEWDFFNGQYVEKLNAGDAILFPSNFMFPHAIRPITSGVRYSIITWFR